MHAIENAQDVERLLAQAHERLAGLTRVEPVDETGWWVAFDPGGGFHVEWSAPWRCLVFTASLGPPCPGGETAALNLALSYNALWREVGHLRLARNGDQGELLLIGELGRDEGDPETVNAALVHFEALRVWWRDALRGTRPPDAARAPGIDPALVVGRI